ncbi:unnamed protein product [Protopolystoma xenopodis]|uniref:Uncharacterized protein n=1 Tax=Protopolystoma xenopodis TaxID=117903 RepID=A0A3S5B1D5_9PLAT|nr:unnamed protein product [Protopolystoma xenopodis]
MARERERGKNMRRTQLSETGGWAGQASLTKVCKCVNAVVDRNIFALEFNVRRYFLKIVVMATKARNGSMPPVGAYKFDLRTLGRLDGWRVDVPLDVAQSCPSSNPPGVSQPVGHKASRPGGTVCKA